MNNLMSEFCRLYTKSNWWEPMEPGRREEKKLGKVCRTLQALNDKEIRALYFLLSMALEILRACGKPVGLLFKLSWERLGTASQLSWVTPLICCALRTFL